MVKVPNVSIIVPCYNYANYLRECVESILAQTIDDLEVIIMDDASDDHTENVSWNLLHMDKRVRYVRNQVTLGNVRNYNAGAKLSGGKYISVVSADDKWDTKFLEKTMPFLNRYDTVALAYSRASLIDETGHQIEVVFGGKGGGNPVKNELASIFIGNRNHIPALATIYKKDAFLKVGMFDERFRHDCDWHLWLKLALHYDFAFVPETLAFYRVHEGNMDLERIKGWIERVGGLTRYPFSSNRGQTSIKDILSEDNMVAKDIYTNSACPFSVRKIYLAKLVNSALSYCFTYEFDKSFKLLERALDLDLKASLINPVFYIAFVFSILRNRRFVDVGCKTISRLKKA